MSHDTTFPKREKIRSKSSSSVTGLSLQMNSTFGGGAASASGRSPIISRTAARFFASWSCCRSYTALESASSFAVLGSQSSSSRLGSSEIWRSGDASIAAAYISSSFGTGGVGSSRMMVWWMRTFCNGLPSLSHGISLIASSTSHPSATCPNTVCFPSKLCRFSAVVM